jgi:type VI protein secretion system component Hcp
LKLSISVLVMMLFLTACNDDHNDDRNVVPETVGEAPPEIAGSVRCDPRASVFMSIQGPTILSTETRSEEEAHRKGWGSVVSVEQGEQQVRMIQHIDSPSVILRGALVRGTHFDEVRIEIEKGCPKPVVVYQAIMSDALLTKIQMDAADGDDRLMESLTWDYMHLEETHTAINDKGDPGKPSSSIKQGRLYWR